MNADLSAGTDCNSILYLEESDGGRFNDLLALKSDLAFSQMPQTSTNLQLTGAAQVFLSLKQTLDYKLSVRLNTSCDVSNENTLTNGLLEIVQEPEDVKAFHCELRGSKNTTGIVPYTSCQYSNTEDTLMDQNTGYFTVPEDGYYYMTFSGILRSYEGSRIWINLNMRDDSGEDCVIGAAFSGLYHKEKPENYYLHTSPSLTTLEKLKKNTLIWVSVGRRDFNSALVTDAFTSAQFHVKMVAPMMNEE